MHRSHKKFTDLLLTWYAEHGRKTLPWQTPKHPYRVWLSEIMLQQTQVKTVIPYFLKFIHRFPTIESLANATEDEVLSFWSGLGYYSRARHLHHTAKIIHHEFHNQFPENIEQLRALPGIGPSTAAAIASLAFNKPTAILDGNVKRVLGRYFLIDGPLGERETEQKYWHYAQACMPARQCADYTQAIMDMGATCCTPKNPHCSTCPLNQTCAAYQQNVVTHYPHKKPKPIRPTKSQLFLLCHHQSGMVYLEKRPPKGIWGGLWCLPYIEVDNLPTTPSHQLTAHIAAQYGWSVLNINQLNRFKHTFTHFHLHISPFIIEVDTSMTLNSTPGQWFHFSNIADIGIAKPVHDILTQFHINILPKTKSLENKTIAPISTGIHTILEEL